MRTDRITRARRGLPAFLAALAGFIVLNASAAEIAWRTDTFSYMARDKPLQEFLREFAASQGLTAVIAPEVEGKVNGKFELTPRSMLELMATSFGLLWYYDGRVLFVQPASEISSEVIRLGTTTVDELNATLLSLNILDSRYPIAFDSRQNTVVVSGPNRYVELVKQAARAIDQNEISRGVADIRVFPLRYAWAADFTFMQSGREHRLPGVASVLRELYSPRQPASSNPPSGTSSSQAERLKRLQGLGLARESATTSMSAAEESMRGESAGAGPISGSVAGLPQFQADGRMNAVVIRDRPERMAFYQDVIRALDVKPGLVEIEARILEVSSDSIDSLGVDWRLHSGSADMQLSRGNLPNLGFDSALAEGAPRSTPLPGGGGGGLVPAPGVTPPIPAPGLQRGGVLTTVLGDSGRYLIARINALAEKGKANILSSPRVLTLDNTEAALENISTFFVRVAGNLDVGLFDVSSGTSLRVTPLIVLEDGQKRVKLAIRIEDGSLSSRTVDQIPIVQRSAISTQAFIAEGESLLIGGYENEVRRDTTSGVPGLSSIPLLGRLFRFREKQVGHVQRMFLLTPRVVEP